MSEAKPARLCLATEFELIINLKTAPSKNQRAASHPVVGDSETAAPSGYRSPVLSRLEIA
jgi:hypothetical protein